MSPDLRNATAFVMPLAGTNATEVVAGLERSATFLKGLVAREVQLRNTPNLVFALDDSFDRADRISALVIQPEAARDLRPQAAEDGDDDERRRPRERPPHRQAHRDHAQRAARSS